MENSKKDKRMLHPYITDSGVILSDAQEKSTDAILLNLEGLTYKESLEVLNVVEQGLKQTCVCFNPKPSS